MIHFPKYFPPQLKLKKAQAESDEVISCGKPITAIVGLPPIFVLRIALTRPGALKCTAVVGGGGNWQESGSLDLSSTSCTLQLCHLGLWWQVLQDHLGGNVWRLLYTMSTSLWTDLCMKSATFDFYRLCHLGCLNTCLCLW